MDSFYSFDHNHSCKDILNEVLTEASTYGYHISQKKLTEVYYTREIQIMENIQCLEDKIADLEASLYEHQLIHQHEDILTKSILDSRMAELQSMVLELQQMLEQKDDWKSILERDCDSDSSLRLEARYHKSFVRTIEKLAKFINQITVTINSLESDQIIKDNTFIMIEELSQSSKASNHLNELSRRLCQARKKLLTEIIY